MNLGGKCISRFVDRGYAGLEGPDLPRLIVIKGVDEGKQFELTGPHAGAGRDSSNRVRLHDTEVSRRHAEFVRTPEGYRLLDRGSANGTFVNNQSIHDVLLQPGDQIQIGQTLLVFSAARARAPGSRPRAATSPTTSVSSRGKICNCRRRSCKP